MASPPCAQVFLWCLMLMGSKASNTNSNDLERIEIINQNEELASDDHHVAKREVEQYNASQIVNQYMGKSIMNGPPRSDPFIVEDSPDPWLFLNVLDVNSSVPRDIQAALADTQGFEVLVDTLLSQAFTADKILQNLLTSLLGGNITQDKEYIPFFLDKSAQLSTLHGDNSMPEDTIQSVGILVVGQPCFAEEAQEHGFLPALMIALPEISSPIVQVDQKMQELGSCENGTYECDDSGKGNKQEALFEEVGELSDAMNPEDYNLTSPSYLSLLLGSRIDKRGFIVQVGQSSTATEKKVTTTTTTTSTSTTETTTPTTTTETTTPTTTTETITETTTPTTTTETTTPTTTTETATPTTTTETTTPTTTTEMTTPTTTTETTTPTTTTETTTPTTTTETTTPTTTTETTTPTTTTETTTPTTTTETTTPTTTTETTTPTTTTETTTPTTTTETTTTPTTTTETTTPTTTTETTTRTTTTETTTPTTTTETTTPTTTTETTTSTTTETTTPTTTTETTTPTTTTETTTPTTTTTERTTPTTTTETTTPTTTSTPTTTTTDTTTPTTTTETSTPTTTTTETTSPETTTTSTTTANETSTDMVTFPTVKPLPEPPEDTIVQIAESNNEVQSLPDDLNFNQSVVITNNFTESDIEETLHSLKTSESGYNIFEAVFAQDDLNMANESLWYYMNETNLVSLETKEFSSDIHVGHGLSIALPTLSEDGELTAIIIAIGFVLKEASPIVQIRQTIIDHEGCGCGLGNATEDEFLDDNLLINHFVQHYVNSSGTEDMDSSSLTDYMQMLAAVPEFVRDTRNFSMLIDVDIPCEETTTTPETTSTSTTTLTSSTSTATSTTSETSTATSTTSTETPTSTTSTETPTTSTSTETSTSTTSTETPTTSTSTETSTSTTSTKTPTSTTSTETPTSTTSTETPTSTTSTETPTSATSTETTITTTTTIQPELPPLKPTPPKAIVQIDIKTDLDNDGNCNDSLSDDLSFDQTVVINNTFTDEDFAGALQRLTQGEKGFSVLEAIFSQNMSTTNASWFQMVAHDIVFSENKTFDDYVHIGHGLTIVLPYLDEDGSLAFLVMIRGQALKVANPIVQIRQLVTYHEDCDCGNDSSSINERIGGDRLNDRIIQHLSSVSEEEVLDTSTLTDYMQMLAAVPEFVRQSRNFSLAMDIEEPCEEEPTTTASSTTLSMSHSSVYFFVDSIILRWKNKRECR